MTRALPGRSMHNFGLAVDVVFNSKNGFVDGWAAMYAWDKLGQIGVSLGLEWAGQWVGKMRELDHFEYKLPSQALDLAHLYQDGGLVKVWLELDRARKLNNVT